VNVPLKKGITDDDYLYIFKKVTSIVNSSYRPDVIVFQSGADSLSKDRIGNF
jgi:acetoin utilization deacetylase AcuC-like enzyme